MDRHYEATRKRERPPDWLDGRSDHRPLNKSHRDDREFPRHPENPGNPGFYSNHSRDPGSRPHSSFDKYSALGSRSDANYPPHQYSSTSGSHSRSPIDKYPPPQSFRPHSYIDEYPSKNGSWSDVKYLPSASDSHSRSDTKYPPHQYSSTSDGYHSWSSSIDKYPPSSILHSPPGLGQPSRPNPNISNTKARDVPPPKPNEQPALKLTVKIKTSQDEDYQDIRAKIGSNSLPSIPSIETKPYPEASQYPSTFSNEPQSTVNYHNPWKKTSNQQTPALNALCSAPAPFQKRFQGEKITDPHRLSQRQKQIDFGKITPEYQYYVQQVPKHAREKGNPKHPRTPDITVGSKKHFDAKLRDWRQQLHGWNPPASVVVAEDLIEMTPDDLCALPNILEEEERLMAQYPMFR